MTQPKTTSRRGLLLGLAGLSAVAWGWQAYLRRSPVPGFAPIPGLPGWRQMETGTVSGISPGDAVFLGIGEDAPPPLPADALCQTLYAHPGPGRPIAVFTDINCPNCQSLEAKLATRRDGLSITWLHLPRLGPSSESFARMALAAEHLTGSPFGPIPALRGPGISAALQHYATRIGVSADVLNATMYHPKVTARLETHARAAETLGIWGTPAMTIGQTLVMGDVPGKTLDALLAMDHGACGGSAGSNG